MSDERNEDEMLGRALSRAIETQTVRETPYDRSRLAVRPLRRGFPLWQTLGVAAALVLAVAFGAWFTRPTEILPVAASPTGTKVTTTTAPVTAPPSPAPTAKTTPDHDVVYFARQGLPPVAAHAAHGIPQIGPPVRIKARLEALLDRSTTPPPGTFTAVPASNSIRGVTVSDGPEPALDFLVPDGDWGVQGASQAHALLQQIIYTALEEPGVWKVRLTQNGGQPARIGELNVSGLIAREDVDGYAAAAPTATLSGNDGGRGGGPSSAAWSVDSAAPGITRLVITIADPTGKVPAFDVSVEPSGDGGYPAGGKAVMRVSVAALDTDARDVVVDQSPLRQVFVHFSTLVNGTPTRTEYVLHLDDVRPWRVYTQTNPARIVLDIGGPTLSVSDRIAVYAPFASDTVGQRFAINGLARTFEANVVWRVLDANKKVVASGHTTASLGSSALWGTFSTPIQLPSNVTGNATLEVYEVSPKDGSEQGLVSIPLVVR